MKKFKILVAAVLLCSMILCLCACSVKKEDVVGTWSSTWDYKGSEIANSFTLSKDGTYNEITFKNGNIYKIEDGTYEIQGSKVILHPNGNEGISTKYKVKGETLVNNDHKFYKTALDTSLFSY